MRALAKALGGEAVSGAISCPGPGHSPLDRSLRVYIDHQAPMGLRVHSLAGDDWRACQDHVARLLNLPVWTPAVDKIARISRPVAQQPAQPFSDEDCEANSARAIAIYTEARALQETIAATYICRRAGTEAVPAVRDLRFHPNCPRGKQRGPALVALLRDIRTDTPRAIQRIFLKPDGSDRLRDSQGKMTLGPAKGCVVKLSPDEDVTLGLGLSEGVEKGISIIAAGWTPLWVSCGTSTMAAFPVLPGVESLSLFADHDAAGQRAAIECARRWADAGKRARMFTPREEGRDWGDVLREAA